MVTRIPSLSKIGALRALTAPKRAASLSTLPAASQAKRLSGGPLSGLSANPNKPSSNPAMLQQNREAIVNMKPTKFNENGKVTSTGHINIGITAEERARLEVITGQANTGTTWGQNGMPFRDRTEEQNQRSLDTSRPYIFTADGREYAVTTNLKPGIPKDQDKPMTGSGVQSLDIGPLTDASIKRMAETQGAEEYEVNGDRGRNCSRYAVEVLGLPGKVGMTTQAAFADIKEAHEAGTLP